MDLSQGDMNKVFYQKCSDDERFYRSIYVRHNPQTQKVQPMISNRILDEPPSELEPITEQLLNLLMGLQVTSSFG